MDQLVVSLFYFWLNKRSGCDSVISRFWDSTQARITPLGWYNIRTSDFSSGEILKVEFGSSTPAAWAVGCVPWNLCLTTLQRHHRYLDLSQKSTQICTNNVQISEGLGGPADFARKFGTKRIRVFGAFPFEFLPDLQVIPWIFDDGKLLPVSKMLYNYSLLNFKYPWHNVVWLSNEISISSFRWRHVMYTSAFLFKF